jgi:hypothetical protein
MFLVVWSVDHGMNFLRMEREITDHWLACETYLEAEEVYEDLIDKEDTYTASIAQPIKATDYSCVDVSD